MFTLARNELRADKKSVIAVVVLLVFTALAVYISLFYDGNEEIYSAYSDDPQIQGIILGSPKIALERQDVIIEGGSVMVERNERARAGFKSLIDAISAHNLLLLDMLYSRGKIEYESMYPVWVKLVDIEEVGLPGSGIENSSVQEDEVAAVAQQARTYRGAGDVRGSIEKALLETKFDQVQTPDELDRIFPIRSIFISLLILTPLIFLTTSYNNSFFNEKIEKKASLLFMVPRSTSRLITMKSLPYVAGAVLVILAMLAFFSFRSLPLLLLPVLSIIILYFAFNFMLTVLSRSYKEMSFLKTSLGSVFIAYTLLPTLFMEMSDVAYISPLTTIVQVIEGTDVPAKAYFFSFMPMLLAGLAIYYFSSLLFNEEHYYSNKGIMEKLLDMVSSFLKKPVHAGILTFAAFPLVIAAELVFVLLAALPTSQIDTLFIVLIIVAATIEELSKNISIYLIYTRKLFEARPIVLAMFSGFAFALAEKSLLLFMIPELLSAYNRVVLPALIVPFLFHAFTCYIFAKSIYKARSPWLFLLPIAVHITYGLIVYRVFA